jgi:2-polyprenyl-6-methoxyphenol hydroxylase-like FAD-dependent oxidoreductase
MDVRFGRIVVLGGGTAGWMAATALATGLPRCRVEVVESEEIGIVGVGEATFPSIRSFHRILGIDEAAFLRATNGTCKLGIRFCDWRTPGEDYFHTFGDLGRMDGIESVWGQYCRLGAAAQHKLAGLGDLGDLGEQCVPTAMAMQGRFSPPGPQGSPQFDYAYHFDASLYAAFLRKLALQRGVRRTEGRVAGATRRADGSIAQLTLADGRTVEGDLFVDCSGFSSLLLGGALEEPFIDYSHWLPVDRAWACPSERAGGDIAPYTQATALDAGWAWRIPLQNRTGNGHVFSSRFIDEDRAREQLLARLEGPALAEPRLLRFTTGRRARSWVGNVVALGLSSGFLEPLESTSIYLVQSGLGRLMTLLHGAPSVPRAAVDAYNAGLARQFERIRDFIILHYCLSARRDTPFWQAMTSMTLPDSLAYKIHAWRQAGVLHQYEEEGFGASSWLAVHAGMNHWPQQLDPTLAEIPDAQALHWLRERRRQIAAAVAGVPRHGAWLERVLAAA